MYLRFTRNSTKFCIVFTALFFLYNCTYKNPEPRDIDGKDIHLTIIHTSDIHSRLTPYFMQVIETDKRLGLNQNNAPFGGAARIATIVKRERETSDRVLYLDSGDVSQGAPIYNFFKGEAEIKFLSILGVDAMALGNHDFDTGGLNLYLQLKNWANFPSLSANYLYEDPEFPMSSHLGEVSAPFVIKNVGGLKVGIIGLANLSTMNSIYNTGNRLGITPLNPEQVAGDYINLLKSSVDVIIVLSHLGLTDDEELIKNVPDIDVVLGGHHHIVLNPPKEVTDPYGRKVLLVHSGAFAKYVGRLDLVLRQCNRIFECIENYRQNNNGQDPPENEWEVASSQYTIIPIDSTIPEDPVVAQLIEEYEWKMNQMVDLNLIIGYAPNIVRRFGSNGGDSMLGNLVAKAIWLRRGVQTDFAVTNSLGIRTDFSPGPVSLETMYNVFPFENTITTMYLSGLEVQEIFNYAAWRAGVRGCSTQIQIAGAAVQLSCADRCPDGSEDCSEEERRPRAKRVMIGESNDDPVECDNNSPCENGLICLTSDGEIPEGNESGICRCTDDTGCGERQGCYIPKGNDGGVCMYLVVDNYSVVDPYGAYQLATNDYMAAGGSGFRILGRNTTQHNTGVPLRESTIDFIRSGAPCTDNQPCTTDDDCNDGSSVELYCACSERAQWSDGQCSVEDSCQDNTGSCVLKQCVEDVAVYYQEYQCGDNSLSGYERCLCDTTVRAMEECQVLPCIDDRLGAQEDGRIRMVTQ